MAIKQLVESSQTVEVQRTTFSSMALAVTSATRCPRRSTTVAYRSMWSFSGRECSALIAQRRFTAAVRRTNAS